ncbi:hypothetical protein [Paraburkholderia sp. GAS32]|uniref:hypothetical protein n=1 Tax=Paraburkholderia sp. GAS32 TaxID=3035129 RepID=UPI003D20056C
MKTGIRMTMYWLFLCGTLFSASAMAFTSQCPSEEAELRTGGIAFSVPPKTAADERHYAAELCRMARHSYGTVFVDAKGCYWTVREDWAGKPELEEARGVNFQQLCDARLSSASISIHSFDRSRGR